MYAFTWARLWWAEVAKISRHETGLMQAQMWILPLNYCIFSLFTTQTQQNFHVQRKYITIINTFEELKVRKVKSEHRYLKTWEWDTTTNSLPYLENLPILNSLTLVFSLPPVFPVPVGLGLGCLLMCEPWQRQPCSLTSSLSSNLSACRRFRPRTLSLPPLSLAPSWTPFNLFFTFCCTLTEHLPCGPQFNMFPKWTNHIYFYPVLVL